MVHLALLEGKDYDRLYEVMYYNITITAGATLQEHVLLSYVCDEADIVL